jgi:hypothetical protein
LVELLEVGTTTIIRMVIIVAAAAQAQAETETMQDTTLEETVA